MTAFKGNLFDLSKRIQNIEINQKKMQEEEAKEKYAVLERLDNIEAYLQSTKEDMDSKIRNLKVGQDKLESALAATNESLEDFTKDTNENLLLFASMDSRIRNLEEGQDKLESTLNATNDSWDSETFIKSTREGMMILTSLESKVQTLEEGLEAALATYGNDSSNAPIARCVPCTATSVSVELMEEIMNTAESRLGGSSGEEKSRTEQEESSGEQEESSGEREESSGEQEELSGEQEELSGEQEESSKEQEESSGEWEESSGEREESSGEREESSGEQEESSGGQEESSGGQEESSGGQEESSGEQEESSGEQEESSGEQEESSGELEESSGEQEESSGEQEESSGEQEESSGEQEESSGEQEESSGEQEESSGEREESSGEQEAFLFTESSGEQEESSGEQEESSGEQEDSSRDIGTLIIARAYCNHTDGQNQTGRMLDLEGTYTVSRVSILHRTDCCAPKKWRGDHRCGENYPAEGGNPAECNPRDIIPCCSPFGWCGDSYDHCDCLHCIDYRNTVTYNLTFKTSNEGWSGTDDELTVKIYSDVCQDICTATRIFQPIRGTEYTHEFTAPDFGHPTRLRLIISGHDWLKLDWIEVSSADTGSTYRFPCPPNGGCQLSTDTSEGHKRIDLSVDGDCQVGNGMSYRGTVTMTRTGRTCQRWDSQTPQGHPWTPADHPSFGLEQNYCRNPDSDSGVWCYTTDPATRWEYCDVPSCDQKQEKFMVRVGSSEIPDQNDQCGETYVDTPLDGQTIVVYCNPPISGRYVSVQQLVERSDNVTLCEMKVYGTG
ncbi:uncharacterized protein LOC144869460 [Branchiostoma floridae x Branchiostoma japonicum]